MYLATPTAENMPQYCDIRVSITMHLKTGLIRSCLIWTISPYTVVYYYYSNFLFDFKYGIQYYGIEIEQRKSELRIGWRKQSYDSKIKLVTAPAPMVVSTSPSFPMLAQAFGSRSE
jgi:hypothetical protein